METSNFFPVRQKSFGRICRVVSALAILAAAGCSGNGDGSRELAFTNGADCTNPEKGFMPDNTLKVPVNARYKSAMTEATFNAILDKIDAAYRPVIAALGGQLVIERRWMDDTVNAYAERVGNQYIIRMFGGMARHPNITADGFAIVACHEMGHHLGGAPRYSGQILSNEGQSDYFATLKCFRKVFGGDNNAQIISQMSVDSTARQKCEKNFGTTADIATCVRASMGGRAAAHVTSATGMAPQFHTPDTSVVGATQDGHPVSQCRLDTYFAGAVCQVAASEALSATDPSVGTCAVETGWKDGLRPQCWYKPSSGSNPQPTPNPSPAPTPSPLPVALTPAPSISGQSEITLNNPYVPVPILFNVSSVSGAVGVYVEVSAPNTEFSNPNGTSPDSQALMSQKIPMTTGMVQIVPAQNLPGWGRYRVRVIALDRSGQVPVAAFSNPATLNLQPRRNGITRVVGFSPQN